VAEGGRDLSTELFGGGGRTSIDTWRQTLKLDDLEQQYRLPTGMMTSVLRQESGGDPRVRSSAGAQGLFQFMPATAKAYHIDPFDPQQAAPAAAKELASLYKKYGGDVDRTLAAWNWGQGNLDRKGMANMPSETRGFLANVKRFLSPGVAEAATTTQTGGRDLSQELFGTTAPAGGRDLSQEILPSEAPGGTQPPPPVSQTTPIPSAQPGASQRPPAPSSEPPSDLVIDIEKSSAPQAQAPTGVGAGSPYDYLPPSARPQIAAPPQEAPVEEGITKPSTMLPLVTTPLTLGGGAVARPVIEGVTQTVTELGGRWWETGKLPTPGEALETFAWNLLPAAGEEVVRAGGRAVLRSGRGGQMLLRDQAAREAEEMGKRVMRAPEREALSKTFNEIAATGVKLDIDPVTQFYGALTTPQRQALAKEVRGINSTLADALEKQGQPGALSLRAWNIGDLQDLRSNLIKRRAAVQTPETKDLLNDLRSRVDDAIDAGITVGKVPPGFDPQTLKQAQEGWRRMRNAEDLQSLVTKHTSFNPNTTLSDLNLASLTKELQGTTGKAQRVLRGMGDAEHAALTAELADLSKRYPFVKIPSLASLMTQGGSLGTAGWMVLTGNPGTAVVAAIPAALSIALQSPQAMKLFRESIINGRGELSHNTVAMIINAARREMGVELGGEGEGMFTTEGAASRQAPGGPARTTD
jgi:hypothetical protein